MSSLQEHIEEFNKQGFTVFRGAISSEYADQLRNGLIEYLKEPHKEGQSVNFRSRMFERGDEFVRLIENPPVVDFAELLLGNNCHMFCMNAFATPSGSLRISVEFSSLNQFIWRI